MSNKKGEKFGYGMFVVAITIIVSLFAFMNEENKTAGFAVLEANENTAAYDMITLSNLMEFDEVKSLSTLAPGNYFIDDDGIVYWTDDESRPAIAIVKSHDETYENRRIYIDNEGRIGYVFDVNEK